MEREGKEERGRKASTGRRKKGTEGVREREQELEGSEGWMMRDDKVVVNMEGIRTFDLAPSMQMDFL